ncbi:DoxX family protein [Spirillospora sp. NPDC050679]
MSTAYVTLTVTTITYSIFSAACDFVRYERVGVAMDRVGVPRSWMPYLGIPKTAAAIGLIIGFRLPVIGIAAATGLVLFFAAAVTTHLRAHDHSFGLQYPFLVLAAATMGLGLAETM